MESMVEKVYKNYNLYVLRSHLQVRARQKMLGCDWYSKNNPLGLYKKRDCPEIVEPQLKKVEKYEITLDTTSPNLQDLYRKIQEVCPEFMDRRSYHLYWKISATKVSPISNYISYLSMVALIALSNNNLYLVVRDWSDAWLQDTAATYVSLPEDQVLINLVSPRQLVFTRTQEYQLNIVRTAGRPEFTTTYNPPAREQVKTGHEKDKKKKAGSPKSKGTKKK